VREIYKTDPDNSASYPHILALVCLKLQAYIDDINPSDTVYIAFDGVAPYPKIEQQWRRRALNYFLEKHGCAEKISGIDTCLITPGTDFMKYLSKYVYEYKWKSEKGAKIVVSASDQYGEGEHKLFERIREFPAEHAGQNTIIYGLDADLLMLSIFNKEYTNLYVYRETPEFAKSLNIELENGVGYFLDIEELCVSITLEMNMPYSDGITPMTRIHDYALLCFFLGNDFLPHIPVIDIRIDGIQVLLDAYRNTMSRGKLVNIEGPSINWDELDKVISWIAVREKDILIRHAKIREKQDRRLKPGEHRMGLEEEKYFMLRYDDPITEEQLTQGMDHKLNMLWVLKYYRGNKMRTWIKGTKEKMKCKCMCKKMIAKEGEEEEEKEIKEELVLKKVIMGRKEWCGEMKMGYKKYIWEGEMKESG
jgi:5'-3' exoribonuclease 1